MTGLDILSWAGFGGGVIAMLIYGNKNWLGALLGAISALLIMVYGYLADVPAILWTNMAFLIAHTRNIFRMRK